MNAFDTRAFEGWLRRYGSAWENRDAAAAARLFTPDAEYYWTPFDPPQRGEAEIARAWEGAVCGQGDVRFTFEIIGVNGSTGFAHWHARFKAVPGGQQVDLDGILRAEFADPGRCRQFREWWHMASAQ